MRGHWPAGSDADVTSVLVGCARLSADGDEILDLRNGLVVEG